MTTKIHLLAAIFLSACSSGGQAVSQFDGDSALSYVKTQLDFGPRVPNTEGHRLTGDWILQRLQATTDTSWVQAFQHVAADGDTLRLRNFVGSFRPELTERVLFLAHWDTRPVAENSRRIGDRDQPIPGANDGASGVAVLLGIADVLQRTPPRFGVDLLFVDGEDYGDFGADRDVLIGSRYFVANLPEGFNPMFGVLFDMVGEENLQLLKECYSVDGAPEVVERVWRTADQLGYGRVFRSQNMDCVTDDHVPFLDAGLRVIDVIDWPYPYHHTLEDTLDKISAESLDVVGEVALALVL